MRSHARYDGSSDDLGREGAQVTNRGVTEPGLQAGSPPHHPPDLGRLAGQDAAGAQVVKLSLLGVRPRGGRPSPASVASQGRLGRARRRSVQPLPRLAGSEASSCSRPEYPRSRRSRCNCFPLHFRARSGIRSRPPQSRLLHAQPDRQQGAGPHALNDRRWLGSPRRRRHARHGHGSRAGTRHRSERQSPHGSQEEPLARLQISIRARHGHRNPLNRQYRHAIMMARPGADPRQAVSSVRRSRRVCRSRTPVYLPTVRRPN
jgi:hypothetical protein